MCDGGRSHAAQTLDHADACVLHLGFGGPALKLKDGFRGLDHAVCAARITPGFRPTQRAEGEVAFFTAG
jgi:hypothetical protein